MTIEHTPGPLAWSENEFEANKFFVDAESNWLFSIQHNGEPLVEKQRANMRRLVACWNACNGISTESLEANGVTGFEQVSALIAQQNEKDLSIIGAETVIKELQRQITVAQLEITRYWANCDKPMPTLAANFGGKTE